MVSFRIDEDILKGLRVLSENLDKSQGDIIENLLRSFLWDLDRHYQAVMRDSPNDMKLKHLPTFFEHICNLLEVDEVYGNIK
jgi:hypothetical protein